MEKTTIKKRKKFSEEPNFTIKKLYRPKDVIETGLAFEQIFRIQDVTLFTHSNTY